MIEIATLSGADLAFIGDAYYELRIRDYCINKGITSLQRLHNNSVEFVSRTAQAYIVSCLLPLFSSKEEEIYKRGRNYNYKDKSAEYIQASGFEAVIGYLYLTSDYDRLNEIIEKSIKIIEDKNE